MYIMKTKPIPAGYRQCQHAGEILPYYSGFLYKDRFLCSTCTMKMLTNENKTIELECYK